MNCGLERHFLNTNEVRCFFITLEFLEIFETLICDVYSDECLDLFKAYVIGKQILHQRWVMKEKQDAELARSCIPCTSLPRYVSLTHTTHKLALLSQKGE